MQIFQNLKKSSIQNTLIPSILGSQPVILYCLQYLGNFWVLSSDFPEEIEYHEQSSSIKRQDFAG
jgi:hypothetical protein